MNETDKNILGLDFEEIEKLFKLKAEDKHKIEMKRIERTHKFIEDIIAVVDDEEVVKKIHRLAGGFWLDSGNILLGKD